MSLRRKRIKRKKWERKRGLKIARGARLFLRDAWRLAFHAYDGPTIIEPLVYTEKPAPDSS